MPKPLPSRAIRAVLVDRDIALWEAYHFQTAASTGKTANSKDPVRVILRTPRAVDAIFYGVGATIDLAIENALAGNSALNYNEPGVTGAMARLENALHALSSGLYAARVEAAMARHRNREPGVWEGLDEDIPF